MSQKKTKHSWCYHISSKVTISDLLPLTSVHKCTVSEVPFHKEVIPSKPKEKQSGGASLDIGTGSMCMCVFKLMRSLCERAGAGSCEWTVNT